jgi:AcrR family transcriptional regulator
LDERGVSASPASRSPATLAGAVEPTRTRAARQAQTRGDETRARVIEEAAACVVEEGFAAASASRIAERAGVTWGVIQYHFGDRAGLFSAVVLAGYEQFRACIDEAEIPEGPPRARVCAVVDAAWRAYSSPRCLAALEILVNTRVSRASDPVHAAELIDLARGLHRTGQRLLSIDDREGTDRKIDQLLWATLRGFAMTLMFGPSGYDFAVERESLVDLLTTYLEESA